MMRPGPRSAALTLLGLLALTGTVQAAERSISTSLWVVSGPSVMLRYVLPQEELRALVPPGWPAPNAAAVTQYLLQTLTVRAAGAACPAIDQGYDLGKVDPLAVGAGLYGYELLFHCPAAQDMVLGNAALMERAAHTDFARVQVDGGPFVPVIFDRGQQQLTLMARQPRAAGMLTFLWLGAMHAAQDFQGLCFIAALVLACRSLPALVFAATGLLLGYGGATLLTAFHLLALQPGGNEAWSGWLQACVASTLIVPYAKRLPSGLLLAIAIAAALALTGAVLGEVRGAVLGLAAGLFALGFVQLSERSGVAALWLLPAALFGLVDGFVLAADWNRLELAALMPGAGLLAFNGGVFSAELLLAALLWGALSLARRSARLEPYRALGTDLGTAALVGLGVFWFLSRGFT